MSIKKPKNGGENVDFDSKATLKYSLVLARLMGLLSDNIDKVTTVTKTDLGARK